MPDFDEADYFPADRLRMDRSDVTYPPVPPNPDPYSSTGGYDPYNQSGGSDPYNQSGGYDPYSQPNSGYDPYGQAQASSPYGHTPYQQPYSAPANPYAPYPQAVPMAQPMGVQPSNGMGVAGLVLGVVSISFFGLGFVIPFLMCFSTIPGILGIVFGGIGLSQASQGLATNKGAAVTGLVTGIIGMIGPWIMLALVGMAISESIY